MCETGSERREFDLRMDNVVLEKKIRTFEVVAYVGGCSNHARKPRPGCDFPN